MMPQSVRRFFKYTLVGGSTFVFDLLLLAILIDVLHINTILASGGAFFIAVSINYYLSRSFVFKGTERDVKTGYLYFFVIAGTGLFFVMSAMFVLVSLLHFQPLLSRVCVAAVTGCWNYLSNLYFNFKMVGKHSRIDIKKTPF